MRRPNSFVFLGFRCPILSVGWSVVCFAMLGVLIGSSARICAQSVGFALTERERAHDSVQWVAVEEHLPNRLTDSAETLELQGDILRARRFPEDAMDYYNYAFLRGGDHASLMDKLGLMALELKDVPWARRYFKRVVEIDRMSADGWNNLGVVEYLNGRFGYAARNYERAVKLDGRRAVFHSNLAMAYFAEDDVKDARREIAAALRLDAHVFERENDGVAAQVVSAKDRARLAYEMARVYARSGEEEEMLHALAMSSEAGMDVRRTMHRDQVLARYAGDPRVVVLAGNAAALHVDRGDAVSSVSLEPLPEMARAVEE